MPILLWLERIFVFQSLQFFVFQSLSITIHTVIIAAMPLVCAISVHSFGWSLISTIGAFRRSMTYDLRWTVMIHWSRWFLVLRLMFEHWCYLHLRRTCALLPPIWNTADTIRSKLYVLAIVHTVQKYAHYSKEWCCNNHTCPKRTTFEVWAK